MQTNNLLTYILYALLFGLISVAGWKACELKKTNASIAQESKKVDKAFDEMGLNEEDSTGSAATDGVYKDGSVENATKTATNDGQTSSTATKSGIEGDDTTASGPVTASKSGKKPAVIAKTEDDEPVKAKGSREIDLDHQASDSPKYMVVTGTFTKLANARTAMETLVKQGYENAEVGKFNSGKFACAIAMRTNNLTSAQNAVAALKKKGYKDAIVRNKK